MTQKDGEASVEDILRSIKQVISREDGPRRSGDAFSRGAAIEGNDPATGRPASFAPYSFQRHSPFGARQPESPPPAAEEPAEETGEEGRTDVFDLRSLDSDAFEVESDGAEDDNASQAPAAQPVEPESSPWHADAGEDPYAHSGHDAEPVEVPEPQDEPIVLQPPEDLAHGTGAEDTRWDDDADDSDDEATTPFVEDAYPPVSDDDEPDGDESGRDEPDDNITDEPVSKAFVAEEVVHEAPAHGAPAEEPAALHAQDTAPAAGASEALIAGAAADALRNRFSALQAAASAPGQPSGTATPANPLEDMVREMLRPMLKQWLDDNMPGMVEKIVEREIARITGRL